MANNPQKSGIQPLSGNIITGIPNTPPYNPTTIPPMSGSIITGIPNTPPHNSGTVPPPSGNIIIGIPNTPPYNSGNIPPLPGSIITGIPNSTIPSNNSGTIPQLPGSIIPPGSSPYNPGANSQPGSTNPGAIPQFPGGNVIPPSNPGTTPQQPGTNYPGTIPQFPGSVIPQPYPSSQLPGSGVIEPVIPEITPQKPGSNYPGTIPQFPGSVIPQPNPGTTPQRPGGGVIEPVIPEITPQQPGTNIPQLPGSVVPPTVPGQLCFRLFCAWQAGMSIGIKNGEVVLVPENPNDQYQSWIRDPRYSYRVDKEGHRAFALINKVTGQAIRGHNTTSSEKVKLVPHNPQMVDDAILWTEGATLSNGYRPIRMLNMSDNWLAPADVHGVGDPFLGCWHFINVPAEGLAGNGWKFSPR